MLRIGWLSTGRGPGSRGLLKFVQNRISDGSLDASIEFVFSNRERGQAEGSDAFFKLVDSYNLPLVTFSSRRFAREQGGSFAKHRAAYDWRVRERLQGYQVDVCMLAGYMLIVGPELWRHWPMLNLHPALPDGPKGAWQDVIWQLIETRATHTGAMVHLANDDLDRGPVVTYFTLPIDGRGFGHLWTDTVGRPLEELREAHGEDLPLFQHIRKVGYRREPYLIAETLQALAQGRVKIDGGTVRDESDKPMQGLRLDTAIKLKLRRETFEIWQSLISGMRQRSVQITHKEREPSSVMNLMQARNMYAPSQHLEASHTECRDCHSAVLTNIPVHGADKDPHPFWEELGIRRQHGLVESSHVEQDHLEAVH